VRDCGEGHAERRTRYSVNSVSGPALFRKLDSLQLPVRDLAAAIAFYERLGHEVIWRRRDAVGLRLPDTDAELVLQTERPEAEVDLLVEDADEAVERFVGAGGRLVAPPFDIEIGRCAVVEDPWGNRLVLLDMSRGPIASSAPERR
jgi:predicted enzyme related to lactoylglutathione lyase